MGHFTLLNPRIFTLLVLTFGNWKLSKSIFFEFWLLTFAFGQYITKKTEKATEYTGATFFSQWTSAKLHSKKFKEDHSFAYSLKISPNLIKPQKKSLPDLESTSIKWGFSTRFSTMFWEFFNNLSPSMLNPFWDDLHYCTITKMKKNAVWDYNHKFGWVSWRFCALQHFKYLQNIILWKLCSYTWVDWMNFLIFHFLILDICTIFSIKYHKIK
jgi:hypothetical protein